MKWPVPPSHYSCTLCVLLFTLGVHLALDLQNTDGAAVTVRHVCANEAALYTDATSHVKHIPLKKEGAQLFQSTDHLFQIALCSPDPPAAGSN